MTLLRLLFGCWHRERVRERDDQGAVILVCSACGHAVPALARTAEERTVMAERFPLRPLPKPLTAAERARRREADRSVDSPALTLTGMSGRTVPADGATSDASTAGAHRAVPVPIRRRA